MSEEAKSEIVEEVGDEQTSLREAEESTGIKESGVDQDALDKSKSDSDSDSDSDDQGDSLPSFFVEEDDRVRISVDVLFDKKNGRLVGVSRSGSLGDSEDFNMFGFTTEWFEFTPVGYEDMANYRQKCSVFRKDANRLLADPISLRNFLIVWHLKDWSMKGRDGKKIELNFLDNGALGDGGIKSVYKMHTTLLDVVVTLFEKDMMM